MSLNEIGRVLATAPTDKKQPRVLLLIDPKVPSAQFFDAMDMLRKVGLDESVAIIKWGNPPQSAHIVELKGDDKFI